MSEDKLLPDTKEAIIDWFTPEELVVFASITIEELVDLLEPFLSVFELELRQEMRMDREEIEDDDDDGNPKHYFWLGDED